MSKTKDKKSSKSATFAVCLFTLIAFICFTSLTVHKIYTLKQCNVAVQADYNGIKSNGAKKRPKLNIYYTYVYENKEYTRESAINKAGLIRLLFDKEDGQEYTIYVNPDNPAEYRDTSILTIGTFFKFFIIIVWGILEIGLITGVILELKETRQI